MKILIAGLGSIGRRHLRNLVALGEKDILLYRTGRSTMPGDELKDYPVETDLKAALAHHPQAVLVTNPTSLHLDVAIPAAEAGCHMLLEKPVSHSMERIDVLRDVVARNGVRVLTAYMYRFHAILGEVKRLLDDGAIGKPVSARAVYGDYLPRWHPWEDFHKAYSARTDLGGGPVFTLCHPIDYLRWLFGDVEAVWAFTGKNGDLGIETEDTAQVGLRFASGLLASLHLDYVQRPAVHYLEIVGTQGVIRWDYYANQAVVTPAGKDPYRLQGDMEDIRSPMFVEEMRHFIRVAGEGETPRCSLEDGILALQICLAIHKSASIGKVVDPKEN
jgi:predicted dehydrogenase